jgi:predicted 3-demethylubiquinone-9 3-methyltransferase (glyoxalase superfamily)
MPCLWFNTEAEEAAKFYVSIFENSKINTTSYYSSEGQDIHGKKQGSVLTVEFEINGQKFTALNGGPRFKFDEAISFQVACETQKEIDDFSEKLTAGGGEQGPCGWVKDKYGLSWQVFPAVMITYLTDPDRKKVDRVFKAFMPMKKFDLAAIERAYAGEAA